MSIRKFTFGNLAGAILPMFVTLITVPLYLQIVGDVRYGVLALVWVVIGYFSFMDMGLGKATANQIARLHEAPAKERGDMFWTAIAVNGCFGLLAAAIFWGIGSFLLGNVLKMPAEFRQEALDALPWMIGTLPLALVTSVLTGALEGRNQFKILNILQVFGTVAFQVIPLAVAYFYSPSLSYVIPAAVLSRVLMNIPLFIACYFFLPLFSLPRISFSKIRELLCYGGWVAISSVTAPIIESTDRLLIGSLLGAQAVTFYTVPYQLVTKARIIPASLTRALFPRFASEDSASAISLANKSFSALLVVMTPVIAAGVLGLGTFLEIWIGKDIAPLSSLVGEVLLIGIWANSLAQIPCFLLMGRGEPNTVAKLHALEIVPFLLILWLAMYLGGLQGAAWAWSIRAGIDALILFRLADLLKGNIYNLLFSAGILIFAILGTQLVSEHHWLWHMVLIFATSLFTALWLKKMNWDIAKSLIPKVF